MADAFIGCWNAKYQYDLVRPVTYIKKVIDPKWEPLLITPPFPEYPSGHSTRCPALMAAVLTSIFGESYAFEDKTVSPMSATGWAFAATSQLHGRRRTRPACHGMYGGIHFRAAIVAGPGAGPLHRRSYTIALQDAELDVRLRLDPCCLAESLLSVPDLPLASAKR